MYYTYREAGYIIQQEADQLSLSFNYKDSMELLMKSYIVLR